MQRICHRAADKQVDCIRVNLMSVSVGGSSSHKYNYYYTNDDYPHRVTSVRDHYLKQVPTYDGKDNVKSTQIINQSDATIKRLKASKTHSTSGNLVMSETDGSGTAVTQTIDADDRITGAALANTASLTYTYTDGNLTKVVRKDTASCERSRRRAARYWISTTIP